jgi:hypothetical protein
VAVSAKSNNSVGCMTCALLAVLAAAGGGIIGMLAMERHRR